MKAKLYLYNEPATPNLDFPQLHSYLKGLLPNLAVELRPEFISFHLSTLSPDQRQEAIDPLAQALARAKVRNPMLQRQDFTPLYGEIAYEQRRLVSPGKGAFGLLYDGFQVMHLYHSLLPAAERSLAHLHIPFTYQLLGTWEESDRRYHARVNILGCPSLISTTGIVEAPAKPREYYFLKQQFASLGLEDAPAVALDEHFRGRFIGHGDPRLTEVMKGYVMQSLFYHLLGEAFCEDKGCRLFNAHWQQEVIGAQLDSPYRFCSKHAEQLKQLGRL